MRRICNFILIITILLNSNIGIVNAIAEDRSLHLAQTDIEHNKGIVGLKNKISSKIFIKNEINNSGTAKAIRSVDNGNKKLKFFTKILVGVMIILIFIFLITFK